ncbi:glycosyltransferase [Leeuwenhoekiella sp. A16]|uniref:glycosyltransferase family 2 protein n=1 Tax=unclassified Leeuwenhoekiella TaxID=2615029 RepID=UPI003A81299C
MLSIFILIYCALIIAFIIGFSAKKGIKSPQTNQKTRFSVVIPFRNEAENLSVLLQSLSEINYPKELFEIILINDASSDDFEPIIADFKRNKPISIQVLDNVRKSGSPKKDALNIGIAHSKFDWIVTTDADCVVPQEWLKLFNERILTQKSRFIAAPVGFLDGKNYLLTNFQKLDFLSLQGATIGAFNLNHPFMCNGANIAFAKAEFARLKGYEENDSIASGDDVFLMQKFIENDRSSVSYIQSPEAFVLTQPQPSWKSLIEQRKRWASKASAYKNWFGILTSWAVFTGNLALLIALFFVENRPFLLILIAVKFLVDFILIAQAAFLIKQKGSLINYLWCAILYPFFTVFIAISSQLGNYEWKGREFKK